MNRNFLNFFKTDLLEVFVGSVIKFGQASGIFGIAFGNTNHHPLSGSGEQNPISVDLMGFTFFGTDVQPLIAGKGKVLPRIIFPAQVAIPH